MAINQANMASTPKPKVKTTDSAPTKAASIRKSAHGPVGKKPEQATKPIKAGRIKPKVATGGRSLYTPALADEIVSRIAKGEPLRQICRDAHMPSWDAVYDWEKKYPDLQQRIAGARERGEEAIAQECMEIADSATNDWMETHGQDDVGYRLNGEHIQRSKLRIDTRLKLLAKWNPRKWGEKVDLNHGVQPENPLATLLQNLAGNVIGKTAGKNGKP